MKKRILVFEPYPFFSGSQRISNNFCKFLKLKGYEITLLLADDSAAILREKFAPNVDQIISIGRSKGSNVYGNYNRWLSPFNFISGFFQELLPFYYKCFKVLLNKKYDFFYFCDPRGAAMLLPVVLFFKGKKIFHNHGKNRLPAPVIRLFIFLSDKVICCSKDVEASLPRSHKKICIYNGIDFSNYKNINTSDLDQKLEKLLSSHQSSAKSQSNRKKLLFVGLIKPQKGIHHLIKALIDIRKSGCEEKMPFLFILGEAQSDAEKKFKTNLIELCKQNQIHDYVFWMGWQNNVLSWMKTCDYLIFSSVNKEHNFYEGFGNYIESAEGLPTVLIEAGICELFTIASDITGVREIITEGSNGKIYNPDDPNELTRGLKEILNSQVKFTGFPNRNLFDLEKFEAQMLSAIEDNG